MNGRRVAIVTGCRTPFMRSGSDYRDLTSVDLGTLAAGFGRSQQRENVGLAIAAVAGALALDLICA